MPLFNKVAVEFVPEGMTAEEARQQRAKDRANRRMSNRDAIIGVGAIIGLVAMVAIPWLMFSNGSKARAETGNAPKYTATAVAYQPPAETPTPTASPTPAQSLTPTHEKLGKQLLQDFNSPVQPPRPEPTAEELPVVIQPTAAPTPTAPATATSTPKPPYEVLYTAVWPEANAGASYHVSGWVVESDGKTPRPVAMELCYQDGCLEWPRPGAADVATGFYEFLVSPGYWTLKVKDTDGLSMGFQVYPDGPAR